VRGGRVEARHLGVGEERVRPPDAAKHLVADAQLFFAGRAEVESRVVPELAEVEVKSKVLHKRHTVSQSALKLASFDKASGKANRVQHVELQSPVVGYYRPHPPSRFIIITGPRILVLSYLTEQRAQPVPNGCRDRGARMSRTRPLDTMETCVVQCYLERVIAHTVWTKK